MFIVGEKYKCKTDFIFHGYTVFHKNVYYLLNEIIERYYHRNEKLLGKGYSFHSGCNDAFIFNIEEAKEIFYTKAEVRKIKITDLLNENNSQ